MTSKTRADFERWIGSPPYEREVERFGEGSAWPGNYRELDVDLAWQAWLDSSTKYKSDDEALLQQALEVLENGVCDFWSAREDDADVVIAALRERLGEKT